MIRIVQIGGRSCPVVVCDACQQRIIGDVGIAGWKRDYPGDGYIHLHKGACDDKRDADRSLLWVNLSTHLLHLMHNLGLSKQEWKSVRERENLNELTGL